jgi:ribosomal protein S18 acetylase RimI-like enzyme
MSSSPKPLTEAVLRRLTNEALVSFLGQAEGFEAAARPGLQLALANEPVADMNMLVAGKGAGPDHFAAMARSCLDRELPFLILIFPDAGTALDGAASDLGLAYVADWPIMVREDQALEPSGNPDVKVMRASTVRDAEGSADVLVTAFNMPKESVLRALPASFFASPAADVYVAKLEGDTVGTVTLTYHGDTCGIWAMGTDTARQRGGIGRRLLSAAMAAARAGGVKRFFLGATPAGFRLYEGLGFETLCSARVWVSGETSQA